MSRRVQLPSGSAAPQLKSQAAVKGNPVRHVPIVVVSNPCGSDGVQMDNPRLHKNVAIWFKIMTGTQIKALYYQKSHNNILVKLPKSVNLDALYGTHTFNEFLPDRDFAPHESSKIYPYNQRYAKDPEQRQWKQAAQPAIDVSGIESSSVTVIRQPYPLPSSRAPPPFTLEYALQIPSDLAARRPTPSAEPAPKLEPTPVLEEPAPPLPPLPSRDAVPPPRDVGTPEPPIKVEVDENPLPKWKNDPYDEEETARLALQSHIHVENNVTGPSSVEDIRVKREDVKMEDVEAVDPCLQVAFDLMVEDIKPKPEPRETSVDLRMQEQIDIMLRGMGMTQAAGANEAPILPSPTPLAVDGYSLPVKPEPEDCRSLLLPTVSHTIPVVVKKEPELDNRNLSSNHSNQQTVTRAAVKVEEPSDFVLFRKRRRPERSDVVLGPTAAVPRNSKANNSIEGTHVKLEGNTNWSPGTYGRPSASLDSRFALPPHDRSQTARSTPYSREDSTETYRGQSQATYTYRDRSVTARRGESVAIKSERESSIADRLDPDPRRRRQAEDMRSHRPQTHPDTWHREHHGSDEHRMRRVDQPRQGVLGIKQDPEFIGKLLKKLKAES
ncbi:hypothetical protein FISHEDRAFT_70678 [Fistulina hepatica ATCC 64428]|uniref:Uncharacterized protein n=1 Tax=Fistulina hepatica ATCC 64428 TaxID=1128425 RepID=A0A0D7AI70_9AGAR|nr:hypothetical protein FISHEDRAFT_70678 [Fistulina hepatica ATCC 64428]